MDSHNKFAALVNRRKVEVGEEIDPFIQLTEMGFEESVAELVLTDTNGNLEQAIVILRSQIEQKLKIEAAIQKTELASMSPLPQGKAADRAKNATINRGPKPSLIGFVNSSRESVDEQEAVPAEVVQQRSSSDLRRNFPCLYFGVPGRECRNGANCPFSHYTPPSTSLPNTTVIVGRDVFYRPINSSIGYCSAFNSTKGCQARDCKYLHGRPPVVAPPALNPGAEVAVAPIPVVSLISEPTAWPELPPPQPSTLVDEPINSICTAVSRTGKACLHKVTGDNNLCKMHNDQYEQQLRRLVRANAIKERKQSKKESIGEPTPSAASRTPYVAHVAHLPAISHGNTPPRGPPAVNASPVSSSAVSVVTPDGSTAPSPLSLPNPFQYCTHTSAAGPKCHMMSDSQLCGEHCSDDAYSDALMLEQAEWRSFMAAGQVGLGNTSKLPTWSDSALTPHEQIEVSPPTTTAAATAVVITAIATNCTTVAANGTTVAVPAQSAAVLSKRVKKQVLSMLMAATDAACRKQLALLLKEANSGTEWVTTTIEQAADEQEVDLGKLVDALLVMVSVMA